MADTDNLSAALATPTAEASPGASPAPEAPDLGSGLTGTGPSSNLGGAIQPSNPAPPANDLPRFNRFKSALAGFLMAGVPGAITGAVSPKAIQREGEARKQLGQAKITFANAQAAHEVAMAHQADVEYQALPEKLQQEAEKRGIDNMDAARKAGYLSVASIPLDQGTAQNAQGAKTALDSVKQQFGAVPSGLLYVHTGNGMTVMKLQDPAAALTTINQARRAQGMPEIAQDTFLQLAPADRDSMARDAINFTDPRDVNGQVTQNSINVAKMRLETVKAQPEFNGKDALVKSLQQTVDHQKAVLDSGAQAEAQRKGQAAGAEAEAAQPGTTGAKVAEQGALAKTPQGQAQLAEIQARTRQANAEADKALSDAGLGGLKPADPVIGYDPNGTAIMTNAKEAQGLNLHDVMKPDAAMVEKVTIARSYIALNNQLLADIQQLDKAGKIGGLASRWNEFITGKLGTGDPDFEKFRVDLGLANTALMQFHVGNRGGSQMLEHFENLANGKKMNAKTLLAGIQAEGDYAAHRAMLTPTLAKQISGETLRQTPQDVPGGKTTLKEGQTGKGSDGKPYIVKGGVWVAQ